MSEGYGGTELNASAVHVNIAGERFACGYATALTRLTKAFAIVKFDIENQQPVVNPETGFLQKCNPGEVGLHISRITKQFPFIGYVDEKATKKKVGVDVFFISVLCKQGHCCISA